MNLTEMKRYQIYTTFKTQIEILPRITIIYEDGIAFEWLWFGIVINFKKKQNVDRTGLES